MLEKTIIIVPLLVGLLASFISQKQIKDFDDLSKSSLTPPAFVFPLVWTILYLLMGLAGYLIVENRGALVLFSFSLGLNFCWTIIFFNFKAYFLAWIWLILLWITIVMQLIIFYPISALASYLLIPYLLWVSFAGYLNFIVYLNN